MTLLFVCVFLWYSLMAWMSYVPAVKNHWSFLFCGLVSGLVWPLVARMETDTTKLYSIAMKYDVLLTAAYFLVPILFFRINFSVQQWFGVALVVSGLVVSK